MLYLLAVVAVAVWTGAVMRRSPRVLIKIGLGAVAIGVIALVIALLTGNLGIAYAGVMAAYFGVLELGFGMVAAVLEGRR